jgi:hypothetical protein
MLDLIVCVYACNTIPKYNDQIKKIQSTWGSSIDETKVKILFFVGEDNYDTNDNIINLKNIENDYLSASYKQWYGLEYIYKNYQSKFIICCGTDTFINIPKLLKSLENFDYNDNLYIGGHGCYRDIQNTTIYFHSGGPGFILSNSSLKLIFSETNAENILLEWFNIAPIHLKTACDVNIGYLAYKLNINIIKENGFYHCNHLGYPCCINNFSYNDILACHSMSLVDFDDFYKILIDNKFFI